MDAIQLAAVPALVALVACAGPPTTARDRALPYLEDPAFARAELLPSLVPPKGDLT
jgi:hypothetical protein